jgi:hypothetical protein
MKKTTKTKKLDIKPERIRNLTPEELARAGGGMAANDTDTASGNDTLRWTCSCNNCSAR